MNLLILTPTALPSLTGNAVTVERWRRFLEYEGVSVSVLATQDLGAEALIERLREAKPDLLHIHHAFRSGNLFFNGRVTRECGPIPLVVSPGGTDMNLDFNVKGKKELIAWVYQKASRIVVQSREMDLRLRTLFPNLQGRISHIPKTFCWYGDDPFDLKQAAGCKKGDILFFLPAGIRPVKGNLECLKAFKQIHTLRAEARIVFAGPALDPHYASLFESELSRSRSYASWIPGIPSAAMHSAYETSDIVLNTSYSEGLSNALLEAIAAGRPILASDIPGNRAPVAGENGEKPVGLLFDVHRSEDFLTHALKLIDHKTLREDFGTAARERTSCWPTPEDEARALIDVYARALNLSGVHRKNSRTEPADEKKEGPVQKEDTPLELIPYRPEGEVYQKICLCQVLKELPEASDDREEHKDPTV